MKTCRYCKQPLSRDQVRRGRPYCQRDCWTLDKRERFEERFWARVDKSGECWLWIGNLDRDGYGYGKRNYKGFRAHRVAYELLVGPIPPGKVIDHLCRNRGCVNPDHLEPVTNEENLRRGAGYAIRNGMRTACVNGHEYTPESTRRDAKGHLHCRTCGRENSRRHRERLRERNAK